MSYYHLQISAEWGDAPMRRLRTHRLIVALLALLVLASGATQGALAAAQSSRTSEALYIKCRQAVFAKYGKRVPHDGKMKLALENQFASDMTDMCVRNGGRVS
jgi:hypothetical protein